MDFAVKMTLIIWPETATKFVFLIPIIHLLNKFTLKTVKMKNSVKNPTKKEKMYLAIQKHGENLNTIFNTGFDPVELCKKLFSLEKKAHALAVHYCNGTGGVTSENWEVKTAPILAAVRKLLFPNGMTGTDLDWCIFINGDARGYALKISDKYVRDNNLTIHTDWGGYGIIAPDFSGN